VSQSSIVELIDGRILGAMTFVRAQTRRAV
jgi:hypothetical protein